MTESAVFYEPRRGFLPPGSDKARSVGCCCAVIDNNHGRFPVQPPTDAFPDGVWWDQQRMPAPRRRSESDMTDNELDEAIRAACLPNMRKAFAGESLTAEDIEDEQAALDVVVSIGQDDFDRPGTRAVLYDRQRLVDVLIYHQPTSTSGCICGWGVLGASHAEHVVAVYEDGSLEPDEWRRDR